MLKVAVVGVNNIGSLHCNAYRENPDTELVAVCDLLEERAQAVATNYQTKAYTDLDALLDKEEIDIVSVATAGVENGSHHYTPVMAAVEAGKDVLVEKPISNSLEEAREMVRFTLEKNVRLGCNLNHRFVPAAEKGKALITQGKLGSPLFVNMKLTIQNPKDLTEWFHMRALHPHSIDVMRYFAGDVRRVQSFMTRAPQRQSWSTVSVNMEFQSGAVGHLTGSYDMSRHHPIEYCEVAGTEGRFEIDNVYEHFRYFPHHQQEMTTMRNSIMTGVDTFHATIRNRIYQFILEVKAGTPPMKLSASGLDALAAQEIIEAAIASHQLNGKVIDVPQLHDGMPVRNVSH
ncbi:Gfo/Idh/MocA family oxidoreductase [Gracilibacillus caseinilyticus]|uniref:Gfo/Idh/MocA family oxidoreductase n=1 Tax=Gracilibacillus caseinilyticus TaxID=2932256 RepID=A0ABY4F2S7_9BACI|nr:Gfo/Idh/MocA family oxidoreductase [Gracilibacillus caseinilyticus]UOQ50372.1 Gfo/Idh/MocA family oxidoreductase [Gracilibacillus caseinilyticus]